ncbi:MAG TPA: carbon-nitrogen hydrolase family protein [Balneolaceae bacterium]|nr:carbon-nitrogen hydrolase family protein [Balneolaceae bacterium]
MIKYKAAAIQMNSQPDIDHNLDQAYSLLKKASENEVRLAGLPENFAFLGDLDLRINRAEQIAEKAYPFLKSVAKEFNIFLLGGSYPVPAGSGKTYNRSVLLNPKGEEVARYDKIHLFDVDLPDGESYRESDFVNAGKNDTVVFSSDVIGNLGMTICYDLRFPELYRKIMIEKADILCIPSAFTETTGRDHWQPLLRARAIENTAYVFAPAQTGLHGEKRKTFGHSMIIDPWGDVLHDAGKSIGMAIAEINTDRISNVRQQIPSLIHRVI